jgi:hypothetical protein
MEFITAPTTALTEVQRNTRHGADDVMDLPPAAAGAINHVDWHAKIRSLYDERPDSSDEEALAEWELELQHAIAMKKALQGKDLQAKKQTRGAPKHHRTSNDMKIQILERYGGLKLKEESKTIHSALATTASEYHVNKSNICKWAKKGIAAFRAAAKSTQLGAETTGTKGGRCISVGGGGRKPQFPAAEAQAMKDFGERRTQGLCLKRWWLVADMKMRVKELHPADAASFCASEGWFKRFCVRHNITLRRKKNSKAIAIATKLPQIKAWYYNYKPRLSRPSQIESAGRGVWHHRLQHAPC